MLSVLRRAVAVGALVAASAATAEAQMGSLKVEEIRVDVAALALQSEAYTAFAVVAPMSVALGIYLNDNIALEPTVGLASFTPDGGDAVMTINLGVFAPYYIAGDRGHNGLFIAPGLLITKITDIDALIDFGADVGYKKAMSEKVSWSAAATLRSGDSYTNAEIGARFGFSVFWR